MAKLAIDLITDFSPSQINHVDISIWDEKKPNDPQYRILTSFTEAMDFRRGVRLNTFGDLCKGHTYSFVVRMFLNEEPFVKIRSFIIDISSDIHAESAVFSAT